MPGIDVEVEVFVCEIVLGEVRVLECLRCSSDNTSSWDSETCCCFHNLHHHVDDAVV